MKLTLQITVESLEDYLAVLRLLDSSELDGEWTAGPALQSLPVLSELACSD